MTTYHHAMVLEKNPKLNPKKRKITLKYFILTNCHLLCTLRNRKHVLVAIVGLSTNKSTHDVLIAHTKQWIRKQFR